MFYKNFPLRKCRIREIVLLFLLIETVLIFGYIFFLLERDLGGAVAAPRLDFSSPTSARGIS